MEAAARARRRPNLRGYSRSGSGAECPSKFAADVGWGFDKSSKVGAAARFSAAAGGCEGITAAQAKCDARTIAPLHRLTVCRNSGSATGGEGTCEGTPAATAEWSARVSSPIHKLTDCGNQKAKRKPPHGARYPVRQNIYSDLSSDFSFPPKIFLCLIKLKAATL